MDCLALDYRALNPNPSEWPHSKTLLEGDLSGYPILLLVDSQASHNFVARELVSSLGMKVTIPTPRILV